VIRNSRFFVVVLAGALAAACGSEPAKSATKTARFVNQAAEAGLNFKTSLLPGEQGEHFKINFYDHGAGIAIADIDGDGDDDLYLMNQLGSNALFRNDGTGKFTDITAEAGPVALGDRICVCGAFNDVDNDGDPDLYVASTRGGNVLFRNDGKGHFTDVTAEAGLTWVGHTQGTMFFDADGDGDLDLFIANTAHWTTETIHPKDKYYEGGADLIELVESPLEHNAFFRNDGTGKFTNATKEAGLEGTGWGGDTAVFDYDEDGDLDLFVANMFSGSILYRNDGGKFTDVTREVLGRTPWGAVGAKTLDYDGDARLDLIVVDMHSDMWVPFDYDLSKVDPKRKYDKFFGPLAEMPGFEDWQETLFIQKTKTDYNLTFFGNGLYHNLGHGKFEEVSDRAGTETFWPWAVAVGDFDNDGYEDAYLASGMGYPWEYWPQAALLYNRGDGTFENRAEEWGVEPPPGGKSLGAPVRGLVPYKSSRCAAVADFDADGRLDVVVNNFNDHPYLYMNRGPRRNFIAFRLEGRRGNRDAIGALVRVHAGGRTYIRQVQAAGGYLAQSTRMVHFGLGDATMVDSCEIRWPGGRVQVISAPEANRIHTIVEPEE